MVLKTMNPAPLAKATGLGNVVSWQATDIRANTTSLADFQVNFVARRTGLAPGSARLVAELIFDRRTA